MYLYTSYFYLAHTYIVHKLRQKAAGLVIIWDSGAFQNSSIHLWVIDFRKPQGNPI